MTLGNAAKAELLLIVWCRDCGPQIEPDPAQLAERYGADIQSSIGASGWCAPNAATGWISWLTRPRRESCPAAWACVPAPL